MMGEIPLGIQLYTVRQLLDDDFKATVKALAEMGYQGVEFAWKYGGMSPDELAAFLNDLGLQVCGMHVSLAEIQDPSSEAYAYARALGSAYLTTSLAGEVAKDWPATIAEAAKAGAAASSAGLTFTYHNHAQEFEKVEGACALDLFYDRTDPKQVQAQLDVFWIKTGGQDPADYIRKYPGRVPQVHLKDMDPVDGGFTEVGEGLIDIPGIYDAARQVGAKWMIVEQDTCKRPPLESARISIENLRKASLA